MIRRKKSKNEWKEMRGERATRDIHADEAPSQEQGDYSVQSGRYIP